MTLAEAITEEKRLYVQACRDHDRIAARYHLKRMTELQHEEVTEHESLCHMTPSVHANIHGSLAS